MYEGIKESTDDSLLACPTCPKERVFLMESGNYVVSTHYGTIDIQTIGVDPKAITLSSVDAFGDFIDDLLLVWENLQDYKEQEDT